MENYPYQNKLIGKKELRQLLAWSFRNYDSIQASALADELKQLGFQYATKAGISINLEDLSVLPTKNWMVEKANQQIHMLEKYYSQGKMTDVERFQKTIDTWSFTSEALKNQVVFYFKNYDPLNSVYIMAFSGARGNLSQVRQLVAMRGLMADPNGQILNLAIQQNFREGLTITDYLMSGYGARKGIIDTALKTANSGYLTRRLIDVAQDILIREKDCFTTDSFVLRRSKEDGKKFNLTFEKILGRVLSKAILDPVTKELLIPSNTSITRKIIDICKEKQITEFHIRSPLTCRLYRAICQKCYGWDLAKEFLVDLGEAVGILAGQSIGEPGTQLTMRTFHTGGVFTSQRRQQILSPANGIVKISKKFEMVPLRTNLGEEVLMAKNYGSIIIIPEDKKQALIRVNLAKNTLLFPKNNQYISKNGLIGEILNFNKQIKTEIKPILTDTGGEIIIPKLKKKNNITKNNKLIWIFQGKVYNSPKKSFINFHPDYHLNPYTYVFRTKIINHYTGNLEFLNNQPKLSQRLLSVMNNKYSLFNSQFKKLDSQIQSKNFLFILDNLKYLVKAQVKDSKFYLKFARNQQIGSLVTNRFQTLTGGTLYYDDRNQWNQKNQTISYRLPYGYQPRYYDDESASFDMIDRMMRILYYDVESLVSHRTIVWSGEEVHLVNCDPSILFVEDGDFISEGFELTPNRFSKTYGIVSISEKNDLVETISIQSGFVYQGKNLKDFSKKLYYPGELILSNISLERLSFCEHILGKNNEQLLVRPIDIYEVSYFNSNQIWNQNIRNLNSSFKLESKVNYRYKSSQSIKGKKNFQLVSNSLSLESNQVWNKNHKIEVINNKNNSIVDFRVTEKLSFHNFIAPKLRYKDIESCFLLQSNQFVDVYTVLGYLEAVTLNQFQIVQFKIREKDTKQILLISNEDCFNIPKEEFPNKQINDLIMNRKNMNQTGRIIFSNGQFLTLQKGRPYFFPNCGNEEGMPQTPLEYKKFSRKRMPKRFETNRGVSLNYSDPQKILVQRYIPLKNIFKTRIPMKTEFSKLYIKKNGKFYSLLTPQLSKKFSIRQKNENLKCNSILRPKELERSTTFNFEKTLLINSSEFLKNESKNKSQLILLKLFEHPFTKSTKSMGVYSITEDFFEEPTNTLFAQNKEFIEAGASIGLLNLEKEITGDIIQGLPRIEEILEARKKKLKVKRVPTSQKKGLVVQKTSLDPSFEFRKLGTPVKENEKINPHRLLKAYFNYYGFVKVFTCDRTNKMKYSRLIQNYEGTYKTFKKLQSFMLNSVQAIYKSQGVSLNDKHLEVILKQMTTKVVITEEGKTPLFRHEVIDLYHIEFINQIVQEKGKRSAYYLPFLCGITKSALNNPSFLSAASFQETTRVLTKAAIEGRKDWLRGLKENIIIGDLIPAGTGSRRYRKSIQDLEVKS